VLGGFVEIDRPDIVAEVAAAFHRYEQALISNDLATRDALFWDDPRTTRYGASENLHSIDAILAFRQARSPIGLGRRLAETRITTDGSDFATAATLFYRDSAPGKIGRQMQTWVRTPAGWRIVAAHISLVDA
jgi:hypothetical protein